MAVPASRFRPNGPAADVAVPQPTPADEQVALPWAEAGVVAPPPLPVPRGARQAGPEPAKAAIQRKDGKPPRPRDRDAAPRPLQRNGA
jgi:hypothetical protein